MLMALPHKFASYPRSPLRNEPPQVLIESSLMLSLFYSDRSLAGELLSLCNKQNCWPWALCSAINKSKLQTQPPLSQPEQSSN